MPSLSLQTHLVSAQPQLPFVSVDPRGFKTALQSLTGFLIQHDIRATLWLKLPKDDAWWVDVWQYGQQAPGCSLYSLGEQTGMPPESLAASLKPIPIQQDADLKREYLCLAVADDFVGVLLAARIPPGTPTPDKRTLKLYSSMSGSAAAALSSGIKTIIESSLKKEVEAAVEVSTSDSLESPSEGAERASEIDESAIAGMAVLRQWERYFPEDLCRRNTQPLADAYLNWQMQFQEDLRSQLAAYRSTHKDAGSAALSTLSSNFLNQAGQELQSPLTTIKTALTLLGSPTLKLAQRQRYLEMISTQCDRQKSLITSVIDLLQIQTTEALPAQALQLADIIPGIVSTYQPIAEEKGIMLAYTVPSTLSEIMGVEAELKQVVIHLVNNGIEVTPKEGRVWVSAAPRGTNFVALTVQDSGPAISKTDSAKLFEAFYRNPSNSDGDAGTGLGLTLVKQLVKRMGGSVSVDSAPGQGTTFTILLPVHHLRDATKIKAATQSANNSSGATGASEDGRVGASFAAVGS